MFMKFKVPVPEAPGKLVRKNAAAEMFIEYEYDRTYDPVKADHLSETSINRKSG